VVPGQFGPKPSSRSSLVSRLRHWHGGRAVTLALPACALRIDYSSGLLRKVRAAGARAESSGVLFGVRRGETISLVATRRRAGLEPVGSFLSRAAGAALLTEEDLRRFEEGQASLMLVVSGRSAGVFVRDAAGAFGTAGNYQDFSLGHPPSVPATVTKPKQRSAAVGAGACFALVLALVPFIPFRLSAFRLGSFWLGNEQFALNVREDKGQLHISWSATAQRMLTILDKGERISLSIAPQQSSLTYARHSGDVTVGIGSAQVRFIGPAPPGSEKEQMRAGVEVLQSKIACLRTVLVSGQGKLAGLEDRRTDGK
jgi:hypothetical protein